MSIVLIKLIKFTVPQVCLFLCLVYLKEASGLKLITNNLGKYPTFESFVPSKIYIPREFETFFCFSRYSLRVHTRREMITPKSFNSLKFSAHYEFYQQEFSHRFRLR